MATLVVVSSLTGNTRTFIDFLDNSVSGDYVLCDSFDCDPTDFDRIAIGTYTWGNGKIPKKLKQYLIDNQHSFKDKKVFIFGSGVSVYPKFCGAVDGVKKIVTDCGASVVGTFKFEQRFDPEEFLPIELEEVASIIKTWSAE